MKTTQSPLPVQPDNLPAGFVAVERLMAGACYVCQTAHGRRVRWWPVDRVVQSMPKNTRRR